MDTRLFAHTITLFMMICFLYVVASQDFDYDNMALPTPERLIDIITTPRARADTEDHREAKLARKAEIINGIRERLGMVEGMPNITRAQRHRVPMHEFRNSENIQHHEQDHTEDDVPLKISRMMIFAREVPRELNTTPPVHTIYFEKPTSVSKRNLDSAVLHIYVKTPPGATGQVINIMLIDNANPEKLVSNKTVVFLPGGHWERFEITRLFAEWITDESSNHGISAFGYYREENVLQLSDVQSTEYENGTVASREPFLKIELNNNRAIERRKRAFDREVPLVCQAEDHEPRCCRYNFIIDFTDLGEQFNFILAPRRFNANYCMGTCPSYYLPDSANAHLLIGANGRTPIQRCCSAHLMSPLEIVYINNEGAYVQGKLDDMTIDRCRCIGS